MPFEDKSKMLAVLSEITITGLKKLAEEGKKLNSESLTSYFKSAPGMKALMDKALSDSHSGKKDQTEELDRVRAQKDRLVKQIDALEERYNNSEKVFKRLVVFLADYAKSESDGLLDEPVAELKDVFKLKSNPEMVEKAFDRLKHVVFAEEMEKKPPEPRKKSLVSRIMGGRESTAIDERVVSQFRTTYQEILDELALDLGLDFLPKLLDLGKRISSSSTFEDFSDLRKDILDLLHNYMATVAEDRNTAAGFIKEIGKKLIDVEVDLSKFLDSTDEIFTANSRFGNSLIDDLNDLETTLGFSHKIDELKEIVSAKLALIKKAVQRKNENDQELKNIFDFDIRSIKAEFNSLRNEAVVAKQQAERFEKEMFTDSLTGAKNRRFYDNRIKEEFERFSRFKHVFSALIFDVDHFKTVNDTYGHAAGDVCLKEIIKRVAPLLREIDTLARYGGEEFVVIMPETDAAGAVKVGEKLRKTIENIEFVHREDKFRITISIGITSSLPSDAGPGELFNRMDTALYEAKKGGRNMVVSR